MDIVCIVLGIIVLCKTSMVLSIIATCVGVVEATLLSISNKDKDFPWVSYLIALFCIAVGVYKICVL